MDKDIAAEFAAAFVRKTRDNGEQFWTLDDGAAEWMRDAVQEAHFDMLPNDWSYRLIQSIAESIAESLDDDADGDESEIAWTAAESAVPVYTAQQIDWLASNLNRLEFCNDAQSEGLVSDNASLSERITAGMMQEARDIAGAIITAIEAESGDD